MRRRPDPLGSLLVRTGVLSEAALKDVLATQRHGLRVGSIAYALGHATEEALARGLSKQTGVPAVVLDNSRIDLSVLAGVSEAMCREHTLMPVFEDERRMFVAAADPHGSGAVLRELSVARGKAVVAHAALHLPLARMMRACFSAVKLGHLVVRGPLAPEPSDGTLGHMVVVCDVDTIGEDSANLVQGTVIEEVTRELADFDDLLDSAATGAGAETNIWPRDSAFTADSEVTGSFAGDNAQETPFVAGEMHPNPPASLINLDDGAEQEGAHGRNSTASTDGPRRILIVDDDFATRHLLVKELQPHGFLTATALNGTEAVRAIKAGPLDLVVIDVMLPEINGFQVCRAVKDSTRYKHIAVVLMSAVIDSGRVTDDVLRRYRADAYFEKPLNTDRVRRKIFDLLESRQSEDIHRNDGSFERAIGLYKSGDLDGAIEVLRAGLKVDPLSTKHHFVVANLLQKKKLIYEAIDEYEVTCDLKPDYFPALTRLAYLYYKKGFSAKAIETWRRSLPHCSDPELRQNIELFMRRLISEMQSDSL